VRASIGADSLGYISVAGMVEATRQPTERLCTACFTGRYPVPLPEAGQLGKDRLEQQTLPFDPASPASWPTDAGRGGLALVDAVRNGSHDAEGVAIGLAGGAEDALTRP
jgi:amidophosphoribosyltransferase